MRCLLRVVCYVFLCVLTRVFCLLCVDCCWSFVVCWRLCAVCRVPFVVCCFVCVACGLLFWCRVVAV